VAAIGPGVLYAASETLVYDKEYSILPLLRHTYSLSPSILYYTILYYTTLYSIYMCIFSLAPLSPARAANGTADVNTPRPRWDWCINKGAEE
jgi:hypothetical protein